MSFYAWIMARGVYPYRKRVMPPPEPPLEAKEAREHELRTAYRSTRAWPDPYGPDPVVFGVVPRVTRSATRETGT